MLADPVNLIDPLGFGALKDFKGRKKTVDTVGDLLNSKWCDWWPASCLDLVICVRAKCCYSHEIDCGIFNEVCFEIDAWMPNGSPLIKNLPDGCVCIKEAINRS